VPTPLERHAQGDGYRPYEGTCTIRYNRIQVKYCMELFCICICTQHATTRIRPSGQSSLVLDAVLSTDHRLFDSARRRIRAGLYSRYDSTSRGTRTVEGAVFNCPPSSWRSGKRLYAASRDIPIMCSRLFLNVPRLKNISSYILRRFSLSTHKFH
jgi:hypothetical protein